MQSNGRIPAVTEFTIDGQEPGRTVTPGSAEEIAALLAGATESGDAVAPVGGGTMLSLGNPIERYDIALGTSKLNAILDYEPMDLVLSVQAGARFADVQAALGEHGQRLPVETAYPKRATIGGMIATARSGPRRLSSGSLRDLLIGMSVAHPSGTVTKCGGMVVKNVSGYDMPRVYHGSLGTLGVIVSANFKVVPKPKADLTLVTEPVPFERAWRLVASLSEKNLPYTALDVLSGNAGWSVAVRGEGREGAVEVMKNRILDVVGSGCGEMMNDESERWWQSYMDEQAASGDVGITVRCSVRPRDTELLARAASDVALEGSSPETKVWASPGLGTVVVSLTGDVSQGGVATALASLERQASHAVVLSAPASFKDGRDVWGKEPETLDLMQALKQQFDPNRVLNPGRFIGHI